MDLQLFSYNVNHFILFANLILLSSLRFENYSLLDVVYWLIENEGLNVTLCGSSAGKMTRILQLKFYEILCGGSKTALD